jgi:hypothetical protein
MNWIKIDHSKLEEFPQGARLDLFISKEGYLERLTDKIVSKHKGRFIYSDLDGYDWGYIEEVTHYMVIEAPKKRRYESIEDLNCNEFKEKIFVKEFLHHTFSDEISFEDLKIHHRYVEGTFYLRIIDEYADDYADVFSCNCKFSECEQKLLDWANDV